METFGKPYQPLFNDVALMVMREILLGGKKFVVEFGSGNSTLWIASQNKYVLAIEHDEEWYTGLLATINNDGLGKYAAVKLVTEDEYLSPVDDLESADLVIIDGLDKKRHDAALWAVEFVSPKGWIVLDDLQWDNKHSHSAQYALTSNGFVEFVVTGPDPDGKYKETGFYRRK